MDRIDANYLFRTVSREDLSRWCRGLRLFRFRRALGGHANDGDILVAVVKAETWAEAAKALEALGAGPGAARALAERAAQAPDRVPNLSFGQVKLFGTEVYMSLHSGGLNLELFGAGGDIYYVSEPDFEKAIRLEKHLAPLRLTFIDAPGSHVIHPSGYPELFKDKS